VKPEESRFIVKMTSVTDPNGNKLTRSVVSYDMTAESYFPASSIINELLPKVDKAYLRLLKRFKEEGNAGLGRGLDDFLFTVSEFAMIGGGLIDVLCEDLEADRTMIETIILNTKWLSQVLGNIQKDFRKMKKNDPIKYVEAVSQLIELFGLEKSIEILDRHGITMKKSTASELWKVARYPPEIKKMISEEKLKLTLAFELPKLDESRLEEFAKRLAGKKYKEARKLLKKLKATLS
jgi:hypothetical protein